MRTAFPPSDYYGGSAPLRRHQQTTRLPATDLDGRREGRHRSGSHVHHGPSMTGSVASSSPATRRGAIADTPTASTTDMLSRWQSRLPPSVAARVCCSPAQIHQIRAGIQSIGGSITGSFRPPVRLCLPGPHRLVVPTRPGFVGAAPALPCVSRIRLPPAPTGLLRQARVGYLTHRVTVVLRGAPGALGSRGGPRGVSSARPRE